MPIIPHTPLSGKPCTWFAVLAALLIQSGCATLNRDECAHADWYRIGREDGAHGHTSDRIEDHRKACGEFGITPNSAAYRRGRDDGLNHYCTSSNGYEQGKSGATYRYVCPREREAEFMHGFRAGTQVHELNQKIQQVDSKIKAKEKELEKDKLSEEQRKNIRERIRDLERERNSLRSMRRSME
jgi:hypothetical protein